MTGLSRLNADQTVSLLPGTSVTLSVNADGTRPFSYQWRKGGVNIPGAVGASYTIASASNADLGIYSVVVSNSAGSTTSDAATLIGGAQIAVAPLFATQPANQTTTEGATVTFSAIATGVPSPSYQWRRNGVNLANGSGVSGATTQTLTLSSVTSGYAGTYTLVATNSAGSTVSSGALLTVTAAPVSTQAPVIVGQPLSQTVEEGATVSFTVTANGPNLSFRWRRNGVNIANSGNVSGTRTATLTLGNVSASNAATYTVVVSNSYGSTVSAGGILAIAASAVAPTITRQPVARTVTEGESVTFTAAASGIPAPVYQWRRNGVNLSNGSRYSGVNTPALTISSATAADVGSYVLVATNNAGTATSTGAFLSVNVPPPSTPSTDPVATGVPEGFDVAGYLARNPQHAARFRNDPHGAWLYYRDQGVYAGELYDEEFRPEEYLAVYPSLLATFGADLRMALLHWLDYGRKAGWVGRIPVAFDVEGYLARNPDVANTLGPSRIRAWQHFWQFGIYEGRVYDDEFRVFEYLALNPDLLNVFGDDWRGITMHWLRYGRTEGRLGRVAEIFDVDFYLRLYPDVEAVWGRYRSTVFQHYWYYGVYETRIFDNAFRVDEYLALNPDVAVAVNYDRRSAFMHWVRYGRIEGRAGRIW